MLVGGELSCATDLTGALGPAVLHVMCSDTGCFIFLKALSSRKWPAVIDTQADTQTQTESLEIKMPSVQAVPL